MMSTMRMREALQTDLWHVLHGCLGVGAGMHERGSNAFLD